MERDLIGAYEVAGKILQTAHKVGSFVVNRLTVGGWGETAQNIQPPHVNIEPELGEN